MPYEEWGLKGIELDLTHEQTIEVGVGWKPLHVGFVNGVLTLFGSLITLTPPQTVVMNVYPTNKRTTKEEGTYIGTAIDTDGTVAHVYEAAPE